MTDDAQTHYVQQVIVPHDVWRDSDTRAAVLTTLGGALRARSAAGGDEVAIEQAVVIPNFLKAVVGRAQVRDDVIAYVAYEPCGEDDADLVMIAVDAPVVTS